MATATQQRIRGALIIQRDRYKPRQGVAANTLRLFRNGAVGFIDWLGLFGCRSLLKMLSKQGSILISLLFLRCRWWARIDPQDLIVSKTGMNVNMTMRHLRKFCLADGMQKTHALVR